MAAFSDLPTEIVEYIVFYLTQSDLCSLLRTNGSLKALVTPFLYRHVDLFIPTDNRLPRIDRFCLNIVDDKQLAHHVESLRLGSRSIKGVDGTQRYLPNVSNFDDSSMFNKATITFDSETLVAAGDFLKSAIGVGDYSAYAALILLVLPRLEHLEIVDHKGASLDHLNSILRNLDAGSRWNSRQPTQALLDRLSSINCCSLNVDRYSGLAFPKFTGRSNLDHLLNLPGLTTLEASIDGLQDMLPASPFTLLRNHLVVKIRPTNITVLILRHSPPLLPILNSLLMCTPRLLSLTYEMFYNCEDQISTEPQFIDLGAWKKVLRLVEDTLTKLVLSVEYCDTSRYSFDQPRIGDGFCGYLDLTNFGRLHTLEVPIPFLTGDAKFLLTPEIYPLLPPNLRHLSIRLDLACAQLSFPFDTSILPKALTFTESTSEAKHMMNARMDMSYMFSVVLQLFDHAPNIETLSVWQPADSSLGWFDGQVEEFASICQHRRVSGKIIYPLILRWKKPEHWNLIKELTVFDRNDPDRGQIQNLFRGEWLGIPLGLASQYHLHALRCHQVRLRPENSNKVPT